MSKTSLIPQKEAQTLQSVELSLEALKTAYKRDSAPLEAQIEVLRTKLLDSMVRTGIKSIKLESGDVYARVSKTSFEVTDEKEAYQWAEKNNCLRLDKVTANKILLRTLGVPAGFSQVDKEHIQIKRAQEENG